MDALRLPLLIFLLGVSILPFVWTLLSSFKTNKEILSSAISLPAELSFKNYVSVLTETPLPSFYVNSIVIAGGATLVSLLVYGMAAYVLARLKFRGRDTIFGVLTLSMLVPVTALILPIYRLMTNTGLYNTRVGLVFVYTALALPVSLYILRSYFLTIPKDLEAAAYIDGASFLRAYFFIIVPVAQPGFAAAAVLAFLAAWNDFLYALILTSGARARTVPIAVRFFQTEYATNYGRMFATIILIIVPTIVIYVLLQKRIERGLVAGSMKG